MCVIVEIVIVPDTHKGKFKVWINVDGVCAVRAYDATVSVEQPAKEE